MDTNKIHFGDCFDILPTLPDKSIDAIITDPPYNMTACKWDVKIDLELFFKEVLRVAKPSANIVVFCIQPFTTDIMVIMRQYFR